MILSAGCSVGIAVGKNEACAIVRHGTRRAERFSEPVTVAASGSLFCPFDPAGLAVIFQGLADRLPKKVQQVDVPVHVGLPDPLIAEDFLHFNDFPQDASQARFLVEARLARDHPELKGLRVSSHQVLKREKAGLVVVARSMDRSWRDAIDAAAREVGFNLYRLEGVSRFNCSHGAETEADCLADVLATADAWFLECSCRKGSRFFSQAGWFGNRRDDTRMIVRLIRAFAMANMSAPAKVRISGEPEFGSELASRLQDRGCETDLRSIGDWHRALAMEISRP